MATIRLLSVITTFRYVTSDNSLSCVYTGFGDGRPTLFSPQYAAVRRNMPHDRRTSGASPIVHMVKIAYDVRMVLN